ncbi:MAG: flagellar biosynthetic protein FliR [Phycisphaerales bacterium]
MPLVYDHFLPHIPPFLVVLARIGGLFVFAPVLGSPAIPMRIKALLAVALTMAIYPTLDLHRAAQLQLTLADMAPVMASEALVGLALGLVAGLPMLSVQVGGLLMGQQMGLGLATIFNPAIDSEGDVVGQILFFSALALFLAAGGLESLFKAVLISFNTLPLGGFSAADSPVALITGLVTSGFELAVRVAAPVFAILFVETVASGLIMKTAPQLNILSLGFPIRIMLALVVVYGSLTAIHEASGDELAHAIRQGFEWVASLGSAHPTPQAGG